MADIAELTVRFAGFSEECRKRAPLYSRLSAAVAEDPEVMALILAAPPEQHQPVLLFAAVHDLVLRGRAPALAAHYPNLRPAPLGDVRANPRREDDPYPLFRATVLDHEDELRAMLAVRHTQTNEIGRCALFLPALGVLAGEVGALSLVDVGTSAGLNQLLACYHYEYRPGGTVTGVMSSSIVLECGTRGPVPIPAVMPEIAAAIGIDAQPIDVHDDDAVRWLEACVWPDQADRFARLRAAITIARQHPPTVVTADAVDGVVPAIQSVATAGHPVVLNSWVLNYLSTERQRAYVDELDRFGAEHDLSWLLAESPAQTPGLPIPTTTEPEHLTVLSLVTWRDGRRTVARLADCHPHGFWLHWTP